MEKIIRFVTFNIQNGRNGGLGSALHEMAQGWVDCKYFQETNLTKLVHTWEASGFWMMVTEAPSAHGGGVDIFYREAEHSAIEELCLHGPNIIIFQMLRERQRWHVVGCYIAPSDASTI